METIINEIENRVKAKKRKNTDIILSPSHTAYLKKPKKGPSPKKKISTKMKDKIEKLEQRQEAMMKKNDESSEKLFGMMDILLKKSEESSEQAKKDNNLVVGKMENLEQKIRVRRLHTKS